MKQMTFSELDYLSKRKITKKERFLAEMEQVVPFERLAAVIEQLPDCHGYLNHSSAPDRRSWSDCEG